MRGNTAGPRTRFTFVLVALVIVALSAPISLAKAPDGPPTLLRIATFNPSLNRFNPGDFIADLSTPVHPQAQAVAEIIQRTQPDLLLLNEFDFDEDGLAAQLFQDHYLSIPQKGASPIEYPNRFVTPSNTGVLSGFDLNNDGTLGSPDDAFGIGYFPGQYGMAVFSQYPIDDEGVRTFQLFLWRDMPGALLPDDRSTPAKADSYSDEELAVFRLSSKSHLDVPILVGKKTIRLLASYPTPPAFDGLEDRNGRRNHDEIRFWADYVMPSRSGYIYDNQGHFGGLKPGACFVIARDHNGDLFDGGSIPGAIRQSLEHPLVNAKMTPSSEGGPEQAALQGAANTLHIGDPALDTADFADGYGPGIYASSMPPSSGPPSAIRCLGWWERSRSRAPMGVGGRLGSRPLNSA